MNVKFYPLFFLIFLIFYNVSVIKCQFFKHLAGHALNQIDQLTGKITDRITDRITGEQRSSQYRAENYDDDVSIGGVIRRHRLRHKEQKKRLCNFLRNGQMYNGPCPGDEEIRFGQEYSEKYVEKNNHQGYGKEFNYNHQKQPNYNHEKQPNYNYGKQPNYNYEKQPNYNHEKQPDYNREKEPKQPNYNREKQPNYNYEKQPNYNYEKQPNYKEPNINLGSFGYGNKKPKDEYKQPNYQPEEPHGYALGNIKTPKFGPPCQTKEGLRGFCQSATFCFSQFNNLIEYDKNKCRQPNGLFGICCPKDFRKPLIQYCKVNFYVSLNNLILFE